MGDRRERGEGGSEVRREKKRSGGEMCRRGTDE